jgi:hypothetical protein
VRADFESGVRAGVVTTPTAFTENGMLMGRQAVAELGTRGVG